MAKHGKQFDVRYEENIKGIFRQGVIRVETDKGEEYSFDKMIITCPLDNLRNIMDCTPQETDLFSSIQYYDYHSSQVEIDNLSEKTCYIVDNFPRHRLGHPMAFYKRYNDTNLFTVYQIASPGQDMETIEQILDNDLKQLGAKLKQIHAHDKWKYFPHVKKQELENGFYDQLEALQGERSTYFAGEIFNFATMEHTADYSQHIAQQLVRDHQREVAQIHKHRTTVYPLNSLNSGEEWLPGCFSFCTG